MSRGPEVWPPKLFRNVFCFVIFYHLSHLSHLSFALKEIAFALKENITFIFFLLFYLLTKNICPEVQRSRGPTFQTLDKCFWFFLFSSFLLFYFINFSHPVACLSVKIVFFNQSKPTAFALIIYISPSSNSNFIRGPTRSER